LLVFFTSVAVNSQRRFGSSGGGGGGGTVKPSFGSTRIKQRQATCLRVDAKNDTFRLAMTVYKKSRDNQSRI
jgi:hypothetical protein